MFGIFAALAEFERDLIRERTTAGLRAAEARGRKGGRRAVVTPEGLARAEELIAGGLKVAEAARVIQVSRTALYDARARACATP